MRAASFAQADVAQQIFRRIFRYDDTGLSAGEKAAEESAWSWPGCRYRGAAMQAESVFLMISPMNFQATVGGGRG